MVRQGINQLLLFGTYDFGKRFFYGDRDAKISVNDFIPFYWEFNLFMELKIGWTINGTWISCGCIGAIVQ